MEFESNNPDLSAFHDATLQDIRTGASTDPEQTIPPLYLIQGGLMTRVLSQSWLNHYWSVRHELTVHNVALQA